MKLFMETNNFCNELKIADELQGTYDKPVTFHCFWKGILNEKHFYSILSCYYFNVRNNKHKIILWLDEANIPNEFNKKIEKYAEIKIFSLENEAYNTLFLQNYYYYSDHLTYYSNYVRCLLLYNYGGVWFDLDCFFLRSFDPLFYNLGNEICLYRWENQNYPNNAIIISLVAKSLKMKENMEFIIKRNRGWGFQQASLTYDLPLDMLVLPYSWFDPAWVQNPLNLSFDNFFKNTHTKYDFKNFYKGSFCFHWHNRWNIKIEENSIMQQLINIIQSNMNNDTSV